MINKKLLIYIISFVFAAIVITAGFFAFTVNEVELKATFYTENADRDTAIKEKLDEYVGDNLLFVDTEEIAKILREDPFIECVSVEKCFPNSICVEICERKPVFTVSSGEKTYLLDEDGIVLKETDLENAQSDFITLQLKDVNVLETTLGAKLITDRDEAVFNAFSIAKEIDITDCIRVMTVEYKIVQDDVVFDTNTEVKVRIIKSTERGIEKAQRAFELYDNEHSDYIKSYNEIIAYELDGEIVSGWTRHGENS